MLSIDNLRAGYGETEVLSGVSLDVPEGEVVALIGRNGVGKTTTLRSITGALTPRSGTIRFDGEDITGCSPVESVKHGIALVPEERRVFPGLTVRENLSVGALGGNDSARRKSVEEVLSASAFENLQERKNSRGTDLSGGEQQMLSIARALVCGADLLMLDEPTEGLAPLIVERVEALIRDLNEEGITVFLVEQNVAVALSLADRVYLLDQGRIVFEGTPQELEANEELMDRHLGISV
ncbi:ABC transporter related protein [Haladaptatus paucihalophilus DX253]|uniref:ABC transporter related protein n=1 Tax=Haladaptatus paucihalophilus DX253 TaxID=797209 RepID=E7QPJ9_HALPU|nr:ABC transporter ATP-binding protein [Haladaptatus paucihalophilus]EFW93482.1 ABC transporter related protein [Haladaptatus paucihalophilus DX253]SHL20298.1 amino acid/amide ABC transporter ATP-binding protein 2, HAAT family [Haladaptatus paucihalophilus DX253]